MSNGEVQQPGALVVRGRYFEPHEFRCRCGCGDGEMSARTVERLDLLRDRVGSLPLSSAYRCPSHNSRVSSTGRTGPHTTRQAIDVRCSGHKAHEVLRVALELGFTGIGVSQKGAHDKRFIHLDDLTDGPRPWVWGY